MNVTIDVTAEDIASGEPGEPCSCPIALAIMRAIPGWSPWVDDDGEVEMSRPDTGRPAFSFSLPPEAVAFALAFDTREFGEPPPAPFSFTVDVPDALMNLGVAG